MERPIDDAPAAAGEELELQAEDGWKLGLLARVPEGKALGAVLLGHAMMANRRSLDRPAGRGLASTLTAAGFATYALDVRGHGRSGPSASQGGDWTYDGIAFGDLPAAIRLVRRRHPDLPLAVLGHSLVAHATLALLGQRPELCAEIDALVALASNVWLPELDPSLRRRAEKWAYLLWMELAARPLGYFPTRKLRIGSDDEAKSYVRMFGEIRRTGRWPSHDGKIDYIRSMDRVRSRVLAVVGAGDRLMCHPACSVLFHRRLTNCRVWHWTVGRDSGLPYDPDHMQVATDLRSAPLWRDIAAWLTERFAHRGEPLVPGFIEA